MNSLIESRLSGRRAPEPGSGLAAGLIGGVAGSLAMVAFHGAWSWAFRSPTRPAEHDVAGDAANPAAEPSTVRGARALVERVTARPLSAAEARVAGRLFHFAFGAGLGGAYGVLAEYVPFAAAGAGVPFGALQVVFADELSVPALGLSESPRHAPAAEHLRALGAHVIYGVTAELVRRRLRSRR